jgi:hypothetical protein
MPPEVAFWLVGTRLAHRTNDGAARTSETLVNFYQTTRRYNPEDNHLPVKRCLLCRPTIKYWSICISMK